VFALYNYSKYCLSLQEFLCNNCPFCYFFTQRTTFCNNYKPTAARKDKQSQQIICFLLNLLLEFIKADTGKEFTQSDIKTAAQFFVRYDGQYL